MWQKALDRFAGFIAFLTTQRVTNPVVRDAVRSPAVLAFKASHLPLLLLAANSIEARVLQTQCRARRSILRDPRGSCKHSPPAGCEYSSVTVTDGHRIPAPAGQNPSNKEF